MRGPFPYYGGKFYIAKKIVALFPPHRVYVEPYGGSAAVLLTKPPSPIEVYNDLNEDVVNFFQVLRERRDELLALLHLTPYARAEFVRCLKVEGDPLERARRVYVRQRMGFSAIQRLTPGNWRYSKSSTAGGEAKTTHEFYKGIEHLKAVAERFKRVQIECLPALDVIERYDGEDTLFYLDPPYPKESRDASSGDVYALEMSNDEHVELAETLRSIKGKALVSGYSCPLCDELYAGWDRIEFPAVAWSRRKVSGELRTKRTEVVWANFSLPKILRNGDDMDGAQEKTVGQKEEGR